MTSHDDFHLTIDDNNWIFVDDSCESFPPSSGCSKDTSI